MLLVIWSSMLLVWCSYKSRILLASRAPLPQPQESSSGQQDTVPRISSFLEGIVVVFASVSPAARFGRSIGTMQRSNSFGTSWADQWDYGGDPSPRARGGRQQDGGKKQGGVEKTKAAAATGLRKVKEGTASGFQWVKDKWQKKGGKKQGAHDDGSGIAGY